MPGVIVGGDDHVADAQLKNVAVVLRVGLLVRHHCHGLPVREALQRRRSHDDHSEAPLQVQRPRLRAIRVGSVAAGRLVVEGVVALELSPEARPAAPHAAAALRPRLLVACLVDLGRHMQGRELKLEATNAVCAVAVPTSPRRRRVAGVDPVLRYLEKESLVVFVAGTRSASARLVLWGPITQACPGTCSSCFPPLTIGQGDERIRVA
mgnify:CR=1 FL=1